MTMSVKAFTQFAHHDMRFNRECQQSQFSISNEEKEEKIVLTLPLQ